MKYKNDSQGLAALLIAFLFFFNQQVAAMEYNQDERFPILTVPILDHYGVVAVLELEEVNHYKKDENSETSTPMIWYQTIIRIPAWTKHARYSYYSEFSIFDNLKYMGTELVTQVHYPKDPLSDPIILNVSSEYSYKNFTTDTATLPELPKELKSHSDKINTILLALNPVMMKEFDNDSYYRWSWLDNVTGSSFENKPIKIIPDSNPRILKINPGDHYRMAIIVNDDNEPEAILLDDAHGRTLRTLSPLYYLANFYEMAHHAKQIALFGVGTCIKKEVSQAGRLAQAAFLSHNLFEFTEHTAHLGVVQNTLKYFYPEPGNTSNPKFNISDTNENRQEEFEPDYVVGTMDVGNLLLTTGELVYQLPLGPWNLAENLFSSGIGIVNLAVSSNQETLVERHASRINDLIKRYYSVYRSLYKQYHEKL